ncbi:MAG TPA: hypothetical protein DD656_05645 [Alphaproteobacteria bacterium]|nr:hypothetical protein [Alphaproteobacteria bacterium]|tara:strand:+ start:4785 stop:5063 length:279 start_codon:yes stop_codon:yes gene_type:complete
MFQINKGMTVRLPSGQTGVVLQVFDSMQTNNMVGQPMISNGNEAGALGGVVSNLLTGSSHHVMGSKKVFLCVKITTTGMVVRVDQDQVSKSA